MFRPLLEERLTPKIRKYQGGARPFDYVMMFKIMILQRLFGLSDKQVQYQMCEDDRDQDFHADSAYAGKNQDATIAKYKMVNKVCEKGYRGRPLTDEQKASNREKSKIRARVELMSSKIRYFYLFYSAAADDE